jgi:hypothetical protein
MRLDTKPGKSLTSTGVLPRSRASRSILPYVSSLVSSPRTTSTSGINTTGLKKWYSKRTSLDFPHGIASKLVSYCLHNADTWTHVAWSYVTTTYTL